MFNIFLEIYRHKLQQAVSDGELTDEDVKSLERLQVMFCIPRQTVEAAHADICGNLFEKVITMLCSLFFPPVSIIIFNAEYILD